MKFWHKLFFLIALVAIILVSTIVYIVYQNANETAREIDAIGREILSEQAEAFLAKIISDQASKTALKIDIVTKSTLYAAETIAGGAAKYTDDQDVGALLASVAAAADSYVRQIFYIKDNGQRIFGMAPKDKDGKVSQRPIPIPGFGLDLVAASAKTSWIAVPGAVYRDKLDIFALTAEPVEMEGRVSSHLGAVVSLSDLIAEFNQNQPVKGSYTFLINERGELLAAPPNARIDLSSTPKISPNGFVDLKRSTESNLQIALGHAALGQSAVEQVPIRDHMKFLAYRPVVGTNWRLCLVSPVTLATAKSHRLSQFINDSSGHLWFRLTVISILLSLAAVAVAALLSRKLTRPLMDMEKATQQIAGGDLDHALVVKGGGEIGTLARSFNAMTQALKETMQQLNASKEDIDKQLRVTTTLLETIPAPVYYKDSQGRYSGCNHAFESLFDQSRQKIIGKSHCLHCQGDLATLEYNKDLDLIEHPGVQCYEMQVTDGSGDTREMIFNKASINGYKQEHLGMIGVLTDISELKQAERSLRQYERIVSATSDLMSFIDRDYRYLAVNESYLKAHSRGKEDIVGHSIPELLGAAVFEDKVKGPMDECLAGKVVNYQSWFIFPGTGRRFMDVTYYPYYESISTITGVVVNSRDITRNAELESQLRQANKMESIGTLAGGIAHDFNNILSPIIGYSELLMDITPKDKRASSYLQQILTASMRARDLVKQILMFSRQAEREIKPIRIDVILKEVLKLARSTLPTTIEIKHDIEVQKAMILADPTQIHQLAMNLITNAFHAMEEKGGHLFVGLTEKVMADGDRHNESMQPCQYLCLTVEDNGQGMDPDIMEKIYDPYFTTKAINKGTGLGLAVAHGVVKSYGGTITVNSVKGEGTTFRVYLPVKLPEKEIVAAFPDEKIEGGNEHILVVDDEVMIATLVATMLEHFGYRVTQYTDSVAALDFFLDNASSVDLVVSDLTMPKMTGVEMIRRIKEISTQVKIVLCTGFSEQMDKEKAAAMGVDAFLMKPVIRGTMAKLVRQVLDDR